MNPPVKVLEAARSDRGLFSPITIGRSVQMWRMYATSRDQETALAQRSWTIQRVTSDMEPRGPEWMYVHRSMGDMLYRTDTPVLES